MWEFVFLFIAHWPVIQLSNIQFYVDSKSLMPFDNSVCMIEKIVNYSIYAKVILIM